ncbi:hypothetical protein [Micromonospora foliorum]|uniref:hypothetical protein n=1 Tax=Micromonospora foliorum TaxID=2911210 RepID=UPI001EE7D91D|nr:hypothetical protein [Micromonospora foliorum]MCG5437795.1 hypothetical protein [Micromonospora foliorum]
MSQGPDEENPRIDEEVREAERRLADFATSSDEARSDDDALTDDEARVPDDACSEQDAD